MGVIIEPSEDAAIDFARLTASDGQGETYFKKQREFLDSEKNRIRRESSRELFEAAQKAGTVAKAYESDIWRNLKTPMPAELYPDRLLLGKGLRLFDYDGACASGPFVSSRFRDVVEEFDPDMHDFCPVAVEGHDGEELGTHYFCRFLQPLNTIRVERSKNVKQVMEGGSRGDLSALRVNDLSEFSVYADRIEGRGAWRDMRAPYFDFVSNALWQRMQEAGLSVGTYVHFDEY
ncbi:hypothetical protein ROA7450_01478 [Roseovarius albus]|uniref:Immunity MXAN-0049 protein domain-containing protein n=1 Tax=Roseovarius albus TaxID=1247867 RepID=A0A1X6YV83_9RHOB|nr:DUF1629 domain-containing protein [Roseovarius albus]SLN32440.1 hypothetical protein ROA7450_01478 [Roseovarius albus]